LSGRTKKTPFNYWQTTIDNGYEKRYIRMGNSLMLHPSILGLNPLAYKIYTYMLLECGGKAEFEFPYAKFRKIASKDGFQKAVKELVEVGFIDVVQRNANLRKPNLYRFSVRWKNYKPPTDGDI